MIDMQPGGHVRDASEHICTEDAATDYVVALRAVTHEPPHVEGDATGFVSGRLVLEGFIVRVATGAVERQFSLTVTNDDNLDFSEAHEARPPPPPRWGWRGRPGHRRRRVRVDPTQDRGTPGLSTQAIADSNLKYNAVSAVRELLQPLSENLMLAAPEEIDR